MAALWVAIQSDLTREMALAASITADASGGSTQGQLVGSSWRPIALGAVRKRTLALQAAQEPMYENWINQYREPVREPGDEIGPSRPTGEQI
jgi:hypothetical protein